MDDYLSAIDAVSKETYVDKDRVGAIGASYGGYSVFMLAGIHENRFKTFLAHDGIYDMPVSYTHLRAHETVLDLVCRLLLEKKKHQNERSIV